MPCLLTETAKIEVDLYNSHVYKTERSALIANIQGKNVDVSIVNDRIYLDYPSQLYYQLYMQAWGHNFCESIAKNAVKGRGVRVVGRLKQDRWKSDDGKNIAKIYILAEHIDFKPAAKETANSSQTSKADLQNLAEANTAVESETEENYEKETEAVF